MQPLSSPKDMRAWSRAERARGRRVGFVPTMGFLHEGHLQLVDRAKRRADRVVMSIFVNPLQFGPTEDLAQYPRDLERDRKLAAERGVDCLFVPVTSAMYPTEPLVRVSPGPMADTLEGAARPGHLAGVLTVVAKLFHIVEPDIAVFGRKDFQQAMLVRRLTSVPHASSTTWCSGRASPQIRRCEPDGAAALGRRHSGAPPARRACGGALVRVGDGDARARGRARPLAQGGVAARRPARRTRGQRACPRPARGRARRARRRDRSGSARRGASPLPGVYAVGRRRQDALSGGLSRAWATVRPGAPELVRDTCARGTRRDPETGRRPSHRAGDRRPLAAPPGDGGLLERARRILIACTTALAACRGDRAGRTALPVLVAGTARPRVIG